MSSAALTETIFIYARIRTVVNQFALVGQSNIGVQIGSWMVH